MVTRHSLNFSGGDERISYFVGANYIYETGNLEDLYVKKYGLRTSLQSEIVKNLTTSLELSVYNKQVQTPINPAPFVHPLLGMVILVVVCLFLIKFA